MFRRKKKGLESDPIDGAALYKAAGTSAIINHPFYHKQLVDTMYLC